VRQIGQRAPRRRFRLLRILNWQYHFEQVHDANYTPGEAATGVRRAVQLELARWSMHAGTDPAPMNAHQTTRADIVVGGRTDVVCPGDEVGFEPECRSGHL
jgi:hypothetical protein